MEEPKIIINTKMSKEDYKKFLYIATFRRNKFVLPFIGVISLLAGIIISCNNGYFNIPIFLISWALLFALAIIVIILKVERRNAQRVKSDKTGTFDSTNTLEFYENRLIMKNETLKSTGELKYDQFYAVMETKDYFIFYITANQASLIRKQDISDLSFFKSFLLDKFSGKYKEI